LGAGGLEELWDEGQYDDLNVDSFVASLDEQ
jgi:hypothetical protein